MPGARFQCWPSPRSGASFTVVPFGAVEGLVDVEHGLHVVIARRHLVERADGIAGGLSVMVTAWPGASPSTVVPKTICERGLSSICMRGSLAGSVESSSNTRPSSGLDETLAGKLTVIWAVR